jgi:formylglycine-generating enzyme required for sulfatase activity
VQWLQILWLTSRSKWSGAEQRMMRRATQYHAVRGAATAALLALAGFVGLAVRQQVVEQRNATRAAGLVQAALNAETSHVPAVVDEMAEFRKWTDPRLRSEFRKAADGSRQKLHAALALLPEDPNQVDFLYSRLLDAAPSEIPVISDALAPHSNALQERLWAVVERPDKGKESQRLRAAAALARYDPESQRWGEAGALVGSDLVLENPIFLGLWSEAFRPVRHWLVPQLSELFRDHQPERLAESGLAANLLADYAADQPAVLADLVKDADEKQFVVIFPKLSETRPQALPLLLAEVDGRLPFAANDDAIEKAAKRRANAAVALVRLNRPEAVWPLLQHSPDPRVRSYLIHRLGPLGVDPSAVVHRLDEESNQSIRRALVLSLGEYTERQLSGDARAGLLPKLQEMYKTSPDPGLHAATEWLLRTWGQEDWLRQINNEWTKDKPQREQHLRQIRETLASEKEKTPPTWYVTGQGETMTVIPGPVTFLMGSPEGEVGRSEGESQHRKRIGRTFCVSAKPVTAEQFTQFDKGYQLPAGSPQAKDLPAVSITWFQAAAYCNWLSKEEGIPEAQWCYETDAKGEVTKLRAKYLSLAGYRLPTEAEVEYATRSGTTCSRYFGETDDLLPKYGWFAKNSKERMWPAGKLKPNDLGLFDTHGNVWTWCQEGAGEYPKVTDNAIGEDREDELEVVSTRSRVLRGGSYYNQSSNSRSAYRDDDMPTYRINRVGFRVARTLVP